MQAAAEPLSLLADMFGAHKLHSDSESEHFQPPRTQQCTSDIALGQQPHL